MLQVPSILGLLAIVAVPAEQRPLVIIMTVLAYTCVFCALVLMNSGTFRAVKQLQVSASCYFVIWHPCC